MKIIVDKDEYEKLIAENTELKQQVYKLVNENTVLKNQISVLINENIELKAKLEETLEQIKLLTAKIWGKSSEKTDLKQDIVNEAEVTIDSNNDIEEIEMEEISYKRRKKRKSRNEKLDELPIEIIEYYLTDDELNCPNCENEVLHIMKKEIRRELEYVPGKFKVIEHVRYVYSCRNCSEYEENATIVKANTPNPLIPKSIASATLVAYILYEKYVMASPLYRLENHFNRLDIALSRQVMASWVIKVADNHLVKIYDLMKEVLLEKEVLYSDDTEIQVLKEDGRSARTKSYMWVYISVIEEEIIIFEYTKTRAGEHPEKFLKGFSGFLHVDGYSSYEKVANITLIGCFAHARRYFWEAIKTLPKERRTAEVASVIGFKYCNELFKIENDIVEKLNAEFGENYNRFDKEIAKKIFDYRNTLSQPVLDEFKSWLDSIEPIVAPKSILGKAVNYCLNQWYKLEGFMLDGRLEISNNRSERAIKNLIIGRKNWLFADTPSGATSSAIIYSISETAKANNLNVYQYFVYILRKLPHINDKDICQLLPWSNNLPDDIKIKSTVQNE
jgi:transposase